MQKKSTDKLSKSRTGKKEFGTEGRTKRPRTTTALKRSEDTFAEPEGRRSYAEKSGFKNTPKKDFKPIGAKRKSYAEKVDLPETERPVRYAKGAKTSFTKKSAPGNRDKKRFDKRDSEETSFVKGARAPYRKYDGEDKGSRSTEPRKQFGSKPYAGDGKRRFDKTEGKEKSFGSGAKRNFRKSEEESSNSFSAERKPYSPKRNTSVRDGAPFKQKSYAKSSSRKRGEVEGADVKVSDELRLNKYLSHAGVASRRGADELIKEGRVKVNGKVVTEMGHKVLPTDKVTFDGQKLSLEKKFYVLLNKPKDFITTVADEKGRRTVMELIRSAYPQMKTIARPRLYPVGRLDRNTTGVLLITNDGEMAQKLTHPSSEVKKVYHVVLDKKLLKEDFDKIAEGGVVLEDGIAEVDVIAYPNEKNRAEVGVEIHTGKNRFVRRVFESLGYEVEKLDRVYFAGLTKKDLPRGRWRFLNEEEVRMLRHFT